MQYIHKTSRGEHEAKEVAHYVNASTNKGETALHYVCRLKVDPYSENWNTGREIAQLLLDNGASFALQTKEVIICSLTFAGLFLVHVKRGRFLV